MKDSDGVDASTPGSEALNWTCGRQVDRCSPIMEDQSWLSPLRKLETPEMGAKQDSTSPPGAGVLEAVSPPGRPNPGLSETPASCRPGWFTNTAVPKFDGTVCWQQHQQVFNAIAKSKRLGDESAALQLFVHLEGEALNVALLMLEGERATWEGLLQGFSEYYNSPGRLAVFRRKFDSVARREGEDTACFATELEILVVRGFGDIGPQARTRMVRDRFISEQQSCGLRRHLDTVPPDAPIREIVDRCRVWESHTDQNRRHLRELMWVGNIQRWLVIPGSPRFIYRGSTHDRYTPES